MGVVGSAAATERWLPELADLDLRPTAGVLRLFADGELTALQVLRGRLDQLVRVVDAVAERFAAGGRILYAGAGTAGRLGLLDAAECGPTFGLDPGRVTAVVAGGSQSTTGARQDAEEGVLLFTCGFDFGFGALVWVYASESFPARLRTTGASAMLTADLVGNLLIAQFFLSVLGAMGGVWTFTLFLALAAMSFGYVWWLAPETKGRPLESIRSYWENGGRWPEETAVYPAARRGAETSRRHAA